MVGRGRAILDFLELGALPFPAVTPGIRPYARCQHSIHGIRVDLNVFGYRSIQSGQFIHNSGTLIQILARFFSSDTVKTGHCHL